MAKEKTSKINVQGLAITIINNSKDDYISITDIARHKDADRSDYILQNWLRNRSTIEFIGLWEQLKNPDFNSIEFDGIKNISGSNSFSLAPKRLIELNQMAIRQLKALSSNATIKKLGNG